MFKLKIGGFHEGRRHSKINLFLSTEKSVNYQDILDYHVSSDQAMGMKIGYLTSSKNGDYADIDIIPFLKNGNFSPQFLSGQPAQ